MSTEKQAIESYFGNEVTTEISYNEFVINGATYQVQPVEYIDSDEELKGLSEGAVEVNGFYLIAQ